jgi:cytochrome c oxidase cbb3-type subunit 3
MSVEERDPYTGHMTTGHVWNGIKELNTRVPRPVYFFLALTFSVAVVYWILMPAWPLGATYTKGLLGVDQRTTVARDLQQAAAVREPWRQKIETESFQAILADPVLMRDVRETGHRLFGDNCAACHGVQAYGGKGFPSLTGPSWLWGGDPDSMAETIRVGINSSHKDSRVSQMPAFGRDRMLERKDILNVVSFVRSLSNPGLTTKDNAAAIEAGSAVFAANCAPCHGEDAKGLQSGAPNLVDHVWIYGGGETSVFETVWNGRQGQMPTWESRLSPLERKILVLYLVDLRSRPR